VFTFASLAILALLSLMSFSACLCSILSSSEFSRCAPELAQTPIAAAAWQEGGEVERQPAAGTESKEMNGSSFCSWTRPSQGPDQQSRWDTIVLVRRV
jgi:hypothetical protein